MPIYNHLSSFTVLKSLSGKMLVSNIVANIWKELQKKSPEIITALSQMKQKIQHNSIQINVLICNTTNPRVIFLITIIYFMCSKTEFKVEKINHVFSIFSLLFPLLHPMGIRRFCFLTQAKKILEANSSFQHFSEQV